MKFGKIKNGACREPTSPGVSQKISDVRALISAVRSGSPRTNDDDARDAAHSFFVGARQIESSGADCIANAARVKFFLVPNYLFTRARLSFRLYDSVSRASTGLGAVDVSIIFMRRKMAKAETKTLSPEQTKRLNLFRYGMMVIPVVAWVIAFAYPFLVLNAFNQDWLMAALIPSLIVAAITGVVCYAAFWAYKRFVLKV